MAFPQWHAFIQQNRMAFFKEEAKGLLCPLLGPNHSMTGTARNMFHAD
jgi:hypothetical protein